MHKIVILLTASLLTLNLSAATISIRADIWCPFNCDPKSPQPGYMIEAAKVIFEKKGHKIDYQVLNWARAKEETKAGKYDAIVGAYKEDAPGFVFPDQEIGKSTNVLFAKKGEKWRFEGEESLKDVKIGVIKDYAYDDTSNGLIAKNHPSFVILSGDDALEKLIKMLDAGRITAFYEDPGVAQNRIKEMKIDKDKFEAIGSIEEKNSEVYIAFSPAKATSVAYAKILSEGMIELRKNKQYSKILSKYGLKDWK